MYVSGLSISGQTRPYFRDETRGSHIRCSLHPFLSSLAWCLSQLASGTRSQVRHNGVAVSDGDLLREMRVSRGSGIGFRAACIYVKGDLAELSHTLGFPSVNSAVNLCPHCCCTKNDAHSGYENTTLDDDVFEQKDSATYLAAHLKCAKMLVVSTDAQRDSIFQSGGFVPLGGRGFWGLTCQSPVEHPFHILPGDRLEPCDSLQDPHEFRRTQTPFTCVLWRPSLGPDRQLLDAIAHACPIFDEDTGVSIGNICVDALHTLYMGPVHRFCSAVLWRILLNNPWKVRARTIDQRLLVGVARLRDDLMKWQRDNVPHNERLRDLTLGMLGDRRGALDDLESAHPGDSLRMKGGESGVVVIWTCSVLAKFGEAIPFAAELREVGASLVDYLDSIRKYPLVLTRPQCDHLYSLMLRVNIPSKNACISMTPKHHFFYELTKRCKERPSPTTPSYAVRSQSRPPGSLGLQRCVSYFRLLYGLCV